MKKKLIVLILVGLVYIITSCKSCSSPAQSMPLDTIAIDTVVIMQLPNTKSEIAFSENVETDTIKVIFKKQIKPIEKDTIWKMKKDSVYKKLEETDYKVKQQNKKIDSLIVVKKKK